MMDAFIALPYLIYSPGRRGGTEGEGGVCGGGQKQEEFKECVANEEGPSFRTTQICERKIVLVSLGGKKKHTLIKSRTLSLIHVDGPIFSHNDTKNEIQKAGDDSAVIGDIDIPQK